MQNAGASESSREWLMVRMDREWNRDRIASAAAAAALQALLVYALIAGLGFRRADTAETRLRLLPLAPEPPPPPAKPPPPTTRRAAPEEAAPPALRAKAAPIVAPPPIVRIELPPPLAAAPVAGIGSQVSPGASAVPGPGTGSGGEGTGTGGGGAGDGAGGSGGVPPVRTRRIRGHFTDADYPAEAERAGAQGTVAARLTVGAKGRVTACRIRASSGSDALDAATCRIILKRFRFTPARDASGAATTDIVEWEQIWSLRPEDRPQHAEAECRVRAGKAGDAAARKAEFLSCMASFGWAR
jgi:protein TonB